MGRRLYVGNLPFETGEGELQELFGRAGTVETVKVMRDMATGRARGFAFEFQLGGRGLTVNEARPKPERSGGYGGDRGGQSHRRRSEPRW
jgi:hypothetical protein